MPNHEFEALRVLGLGALLAVLTGSSVASQAPEPAALAPAAKAAPPQAAAAPRPRPPVAKSSLSNGLRLLCRTNTATEMISIVCIVRAGLADEREDQAGIAALTAEALLKGTTTHPGASFATAVLNAGGNLQTLPGYDFTEISIVASREQFEPALKLIADVVAHPRFSAEDVEEARDAVKRRASSIQDDFTGASYQSLVSQLHPETPYGRPITGFPEAQSRITPAQVRHFWQTHYVQNRIVVAVVGDIDASRALNLAQKAFKDVPRNPNAGNAQSPTQTLTRPRLELIQRPSPLPSPAAQVMLGFLVPAATRETYPVYAVLDAIVGGGKRARLFSNIREKQSLGYLLGSFYQPLLHQSHLVGYVVTPPFRRNARTEQAEGVMEQVKGLLLEQYRQLAVAGPTDQELARARAYVVGRYALRGERVRDQAKWLAWNLSMGLGADFNEYFAARVPAVTKEQIQAAAKRMVNQYALVVTMPEEK